MSARVFDRVLTGEHAGFAASWELPAVAGPAANRRARNGGNGPVEPERSAWDIGYEKGHAAGADAAEKECEQRIAELDRQLAQAKTLLATLSTPLEQLDSDVEEQLVALAFAVAKHMVRRELKMDPTQIIAVVRETVGLLPVSQRDVRVHLHPQDAATLRERLAEPQTARAWVIVEDPMMTRGGCRVTTDTAQIDARIETRLAAAFNQLLGDERAAAVREES